MRGLSDVELSSLWFIGLLRILLNPNTSANITDRFAAAATASVALQREGQTSIRLTHWDALVQSIDV